MSHDGKAVYDSRLEADCARVLDLLTKQGRIRSYGVQVPFVLAPPRGKERAVTYVRPRMPEHNDSDFYWALGLTEARLALGQRQADVSAASGLGRSCIAMIETGRQSVNVHQLVALAAALHVSTGWLLGDEHSNGDRHMFEIVTLRTADGGLVVRGRIPRFRPHVEVLQWGSRLFARRDDGDYDEVTFFVVMPEWEVLADERKD